MIKSSLNVRVEALPSKGANSYNNFQSGKVPGRVPPKSIWVVLRFLSAEVRLAKLDWLYFYAAWPAGNSSRGRVNAGCQQIQSVPMFGDLAVSKAKNVKMSGNHFLSRIVRVILRRPW